MMKSEELSVGPAFVGNHDMALCASIQPASMRGDSAKGLAKVVHFTAHLITQEDWYRRSPQIETSCDCFSRKLINYK